MKKTLMATLLALGIGMANWAAAQAVVGQAAPAFTTTDTTGKAVSLSEFKGKYVVLEWFNPGCPFVQKHYNGGNMPSAQKHAASKGVVWLSVNTTDTDGSTTKARAELSAWSKSKNATPTAILVDTNGKVGRAYGARATPHMYLIDPQGKLVYAGAIDSKPSANPADIATATNYIVQAIDEVSAGKPVSRPVTQAYGCSVKYSDA